MNPTADSWEKAQEMASLFLDIARALDEKFSVNGRCTIREGVRRYALKLSEFRLSELNIAGSLYNTSNLLSHDFGFPCPGISKEWVNHSPSEFMVNILKCPFADFWLEHDAGDYGHMYCEEFYPALMKKPSFGKAQVNLGRMLLDQPHSNLCRLSIYLRPANLDSQQRSKCFEDYNPNPCKYCKPPLTEVNFAVKERTLKESMLTASEYVLGQNGKLIVAKVLSSRER